MNETDKKIIRHESAARINAMENEIQFLNYLLSTSLITAVDMVRVHLAALSEQVKEQRSYIKELERL